VLVKKRSRKDPINGAVLCPITALFLPEKRTFVGKGISLGLSISKGIMQKHGGDLVYDVTHVNTCFIVRFKNTVM
jgi:signal transduction histidine kinase